MENKLIPRLISLKKVQDTEGILVVGEYEKEIPFPIKRVFWIYDVPEGIERANHACRNSDSVLICIKGEIKILLDDGKKEFQYFLNSSDKGVLVPRMVWMKTSEFSADAILLVLSSGKYYPEEYCDDYDMFLRETSL